MRAALPWEILSLETTHVADVTAAVGFRVGIDNFAVETGAGNAEPLCFHVARVKFRFEREFYDLRIDVPRLARPQPLETVAGSGN